MMLQTIKDYFWPHNVIRIKTLPRWWNDRDTVLVHCIAQILNDYFEQEKPFEWFQLEPDSPRHELLDISKWLNENLDKLYINDKEQQKLLTQKLTRVIELRDYLWT